MTLFKIETQSDSALVEIDTEDKEQIRDILKEFLKDRNYYYVNELLVELEKRGYKTKMVVPIKINWWEIQPNRDTDRIVHVLLKTDN